MDNVLYVGLSHQMALRRHMDILANNLANMNTNAFRNESVLFQEYLMDGGNIATRNAKQIAFVQDFGVVRDIAEGEFVTTGNKLDLAISGQGFFVVQDPEGNEYYTRNGHFTRAETGELVTSAGHVLMSENNTPFVVDITETDIEVASDGTVSVSAGILGKIQVIGFDNEHQLEKIGDSLFSSEEPPVEAEAYRVVQGVLEGSNVQPILEMTKMIEVMRTYQSTTRLVDTYQELQREAIRKLGEVR